MTTKTDTAWLDEADHRELADYLEASHESDRYDEFLDSLRSQLLRKGELSEKQVAALRKSKARQAEWDRERAEEQANQPDPAPIPEEVLEGRTQITGEILSSKYKDTMYGSTLKMLVL